MVADWAWCFRSLGRSWLRGYSCGRLFLATSSLLLGTIREDEYSAVGGGAALRGRRGGLSALLYRRTACVPGQSNAVEYRQVFPFKWHRVTPGHVDWDSCLGRAHRGFQADFK